MNGVRTIRKPEGGEEYEVQWEGAKKTFTDRAEAYEVLGLHMAQDAGRVLTPEQGARLVSAAAEQPAG